MNTGSAILQKRSTGIRLKKGRMLMNRRKTGKKVSWVGYAFLAPWLLGFFGLTVIPMISSLYFSFTKYDMLTDPVMYGVQNYSNMLRDAKFAKVLW